MSAWPGAIPRAHGGSAGCAGDGNDRSDDADGGFMSVINKMLQDLDARQADRHPGMAMPDEVRPLPQEPRSRAPGLVLASAVLLLAGAAA